MRLGLNRRTTSVGIILLIAATIIAMVLARQFITTPPKAHAASATLPCTMSAQQVMSAGHSHHIGGIVVAGCLSGGGAHKPPPEPAFNGGPPLLLNATTCHFAPCKNGNVMMTASTGPLVVVPIFWNPAGFPISSAYKNIILSYLGDVAKNSGQSQNVFSVLNEYYGTNGQIHYNIKLGPVLTDSTTSFTDPTLGPGCTLEAADTTGIYADGSGYSACVDDAQLQAEIDSVVAANGLPDDLSHIYVLYTPKAVESCFLPGETTSVAPNGQFCTINNQPTAAYCAYHNMDPSSAVYANMPYAIYGSPTGFTCSSDARFPVVQSPNGNPDADTEISPTSHEINESITDPDTESGWYDQFGFENGDECAYIFGRTRGVSGAFYNQVINGGHFLTQEEFSNNLFNSSGGTAGCLQGA
jgi:hypothetical protein